LLALSVAMLISALENIGVADFQRDLAFEKEFGLYLGPRTLGVVACLATAYVWQSYWALVVGILTTRSTETLCTYLMHNYRPRLSLRAWRQIVEFSFWSWMVSWVSLIRDRIDSFVIGRLLGTTQVGLYSVAFDIGFLTATELVGPICRVLFPGLVQVKSRGKDVADVYFRAISATLVIILPAGTGLALVADPLVRLAVGSRWLAAVPLVQIFAVIGTFGVVTHISKTLLTVYGMMKVQFVSTAIILLIRLALLIVLISKFGLVGAGFAVAVVAVLEEFFYLIVTFRLFNLRPADLLTVNWRSLVATAAMAGAVLLMKGLLVRAPDPTFSHLFAQVMGGVVTYVTVLASAWLAAGRPLGAEAQIIAVVREAARLIRRHWRPAR
jgi:O-antigen/teichoic acid export membrane protein